MLCKFHKLIDKCNKSRGDAPHIWHMYGCLKWVQLLSMYESEHVRAPTPFKTCDTVACPLSVCV